MAKLQLVRDTGRHLNSEPREWSRPKYDDYDPSDLVAQLKGELEEEYPDTRWDRRGDARPPDDDYYYDDQPAEPPPSRRPEPPGQREDFRRDAGHRAASRHPRHDRSRIDHGYDDGHPEAPRPRRDDPYDDYGSADRRAHSARGRSGGQRPRDPYPERPPADHGYDDRYAEPPRQRREETYYDDPAPPPPQPAAARRRDAAGGQRPRAPYPEHPQADYETYDHRYPEAPRPHREDPSHDDYAPSDPRVDPGRTSYGDQPPRRSMAKRLTAVALTGSAFIAAAAVVYLAIVGGALDSILARSDGAAPATGGIDAKALAAAQSGQADPVADQIDALQLASQPAAEAAPTVTPPASATETAPTPVQPAVPDIPGLAILIRNTFVALEQANTTGNYAVFREIAAPGLQEASTAASLSDAFADLRGRDLDLNEILVVSPTLRSTPVVSDDGLMRLTGVFPLGQSTVDFDLVFQSVDGRWRLFGIGIRPPDDADAADESTTHAKGVVPDSQTLVKLIRGTVIALNQANRAGDYAVLRDIGSPGFQEANSPAQLSAHFAELRARDLDLSPVAVIDPGLFRAPKIDDNGYLRLTGFFPSKPEQVNFDLAFQFAGGEWKLFGIGVNTSRQVPQTADATPANADATGVGATPVTSATPSVAEPPAPRLRPLPQNQNAVGASQSQPLTLQIQ